MAVECQYCGRPAELASGAAIYPARAAEFGGMNFWRCAPCGAWVGCHRAGSWRLEGGVKVMHDGTEPLGVLANADLRRAKSRAHAAFDPIWSAPGAPMSRRGAHRWLAKELGITPDHCHIGMFSLAQCIAVEAIANKYRARNPIPGRPTRRLCEQ